MIISLNDDESKGSERIWLESGFFGDQRAELIILKGNFPFKIVFAMLIKAQCHLPKEVKKQFI